MLKMKLLFFLFLWCGVSNAASWERLYSMRSTDCFRSVQNVPSGGYILAGYTANYTANDTDALVIRLDEDGDEMWTVVYDGPNSKEDCFYKVVPTSDGGFVLCGYSRSFGSGENALIVKLSSSGNIQWVDDWGGSGTERAQDIVQLPNGKYVVCGYSTTSPARYYDAFILKLSSSGNTEWSKIYGTTGYDDANSIKLLPDGGFITGGQSNNQLFLIRTDSGGDSLWTKTFGTSGVDNIECVNFAQDGDGFILSGSTDGSGSGGDDGYIVRVDTGGNQLWSKTIGGSLNDDIHRIEPTSDGGYVCSGTSSQGSWSNPNIWLMKVDVNGNSSWQKYFGGENHDHGYSGTQTPDGGYIVCGHTRSFNGSSNIEEAFVVRTNSSGNVSNKLNYTTVKSLISPSSVACGTANVQVSVEVVNYGEATVTSIPVTVEITGAITQTLTKTLNSNVDRNEVETVTFSTTIDMSGGGTFNFHCYTGNDHDVMPPRNYLNKIITAGSPPPPPSAADESRCGPGSVTLTATSPDLVSWYAAPSGGSSLHSGSSFSTPILSSSETYYVQAGTSCPSARIPVNVIIDSVPSDPIAISLSRCGDGEVTLTSSSGDSLIWYDAYTGGNVVGSGQSFTTPVLSSTTDFFVQAGNTNCVSNMVPVTAGINPIPVLGFLDTIIVSTSGYLLDAGSGYNEYLWNTTDTTSSINIAATGNYCVSVVDSNGCTTTECTYVLLTVGVQENDEMNNSVFPVPSTGIISIRLNRHIPGAKLSIFNIMGAQVYTDALNHYEQEIDLSALGTGIYFVKIGDANQSGKKIILH